MSYFLDSGPKFTGLVSLNAEGIVLDHLSFRFWIYLLVRDNRDQSFKLYEIEPNFACFWPQIFLGEGPEFLDLHSVRYRSRGKVSQQSAA